ncbi:alpha-galactosidase [Pseudozyma hubeiensis SY62]|uniref:Alpha-galactosidase n=1 Tax=Pseudozyma hubeiensis (strain SY62) TaxID=1305764 RepID=R9P9V3_PSEHS|nr:alpha-galactosidase [Pseudozyma hubeiensis SY62]GAC98156.1 alpha-galactosidase [Pseudozyma hubeiensis SY62]
MGWNTWNTFACNISQDTVLSAARAIKSENLDQYGYNYVVIDDCWQADQRDNGTNVLPANKEKFPNGLKAVVDEIKSMGLKAGIYSSAGVMTCGHHIGSLGYEEVDATSWASDGFEYLKYDNCFNQGESGSPKLSFDRYNAMSQALNKTTGEPILYSMCNWGEDWPWLFATEIANSWRISGDIYPTFNRDDDRCPCTDITHCNLQGFHCSIAKILDFAASLGQKAYPGAWNDLDMLEVGNRGLNLDESLVHFSMWAMLKSPLILGNDLTKMTNQTRAIIKNKHVIDISQDPTGSPGVRLWKKQHEDGNTQMWKIALSNGTYAVAAINVSESPKNVSISMDDIFFDEYLDNEDLNEQPWNAYDLWKGVDFSKNPTEPVAMETMKVQGGPFTGKLPEVTVPTHGIKLYKLTPASGSTGSAQKRSSDGLDKVSRDFAEMRPSRIMGSQAFL